MKKRLQTNHKNGKVLIEALGGFHNFCSADLTQRSRTLRRSFFSAQDTGFWGFKVISSSNREMS